MMRKITTVLIAVTALTACERVALWTTPAKKASEGQSTAAKQAEQSFWQSLHGGRYQDIPHLEKQFTSAYLANPNDATLAARLGFLHIWKLTERARQTLQSPLITDEARLAKSYFSQAVLMKPDNPIYLGFYADTQLATGQIDKDDREQVRGYFNGKSAIAAWPEFNYFTIGYAMSSLPASDDHFQEGLDWQWATLDRCIKQRISRTNPDYSAFMKLETQSGRMRVCWNSDKAPHNFEGFFMNMGDMLVKAGDWQTGVKIYKNARLSKTYSKWPFKQMLEQRIKQAQENVIYFNQDHATADRAIMFNSGYGCAVCHQK